LDFEIVHHQNNYRKTARIISTFTLFGSFTTSLEERQGSSFLLAFSKNALQTLKLGKETSTLPLQELWPLNRIRVERRASWKEELTLFSSGRLLASESLLSGFCPQAKWWVNKPSRFEMGSQSSSHLGLSFSLRRSLSYMFW
jgi:hypothetical protein